MNGKPLRSIMENWVRTTILFSVALILWESECNLIATLYFSISITALRRFGRGFSKFRKRYYQWLLKNQSCGACYISECSLSSWESKVSITKKRIAVKPVTLPGLVISFVMLHLRSKTLVLVGCWPAVAAEGQRSLFDRLPLSFAMKWPHAPIFVSLPQPDKSRKRNKLPKGGSVDSNTGSALVHFIIYNTTSSNYLPMKC